MLPVSDFWGDFPAHFFLEFSSEAATIPLPCMANTLVLSFFSAPSPQLDRVEFRPQSGPAYICARGITVGAHAGAPAGTFHWTKAVRALCVLVLKTHLHRNDPTIVPSLIGTKGSLAVALDYAISKEPQWLVDMFGADKDGRATARRLLKRGNPEGKRPGPVTVAFKESFMKDLTLRVVLDNRKASGKNILALLNAMQDDVSTEALQNHPQRKSAQNRYFDLLPLASPLVEEVALVPVSISDLVLDLIDTNGPMTEKELVQCSRDFLSPFYREGAFTSSIRGLLSGSLLTQDRGAIDVSSHTRQQRNSLLKRFAELAAGHHLDVDRPTSRSIRATVSSPAEMDQILAPLYTLCLEHTSRNDRTWWHLKHPLWPLMRPQAECAKAEDFPQFRNTSYTCSAATPIDRWVQQFYGRVGVTGHLNVSSMFRSDFWIIGDFFVGHWIPPELLDALSSFVRSYSDVSSFDNVQLNRIFYKNAEKCSIEVLHAPGLTAWLRRHLESASLGQTGYPLQVAA